MMIDQGSPDRWIYKRDPVLSLPRDQAIRATPGGIRYLAPHIVLLFKAKYARDKDNADFRIALPRLTAGDRSDLLGWLERMHPGHPWIRAIHAD